RCYRRCHQSAPSTKKAPSHTTTSLLLSDHSSQKAETRAVTNNLATVRISQIPATAMIVNMTSGILGPPHNPSILVVVKAEGRLGEIQDGAAAELSAGVHVQRDEPLGLQGVDLHPAFDEWDPA